MLEFKHCYLGVAIAKCTTCKGWPRILTININSAKPRTKSLHIYIQFKFGKHKARKPMATHISTFIVNMYILEINNRGNAMYKERRRNYNGNKPAWPQH